METSLAQVTPLTQNIGEGKTTPDLSQYQQAGGYEGLKKAVQQNSSEVLEEIKQSNLRGRGGAGFPTGLKWSFVPSGDNAPKTKYVVCNADEMEPGTFKDRMLMEGDPHQLIEGMAIAAYTIQASVGYVFLRFEYTESARLLEQAIEECKKNNLLGNNILGTGFNFELYVHTSAGRYICGEGTALLNSLEGRRGIPRAKPPFPQVAGLWGKPTIVNNVETFCNIPHII
ncbi:MAG: NADH-quinone oxidoreductase subunit F, partial [Moraxellaceae bacterium]